MKKLILIITSSIWILLLSTIAWADVIVTNEWVDFTGEVTINGEPAPVGSVVNAYDPTGVHCGTFIVGISGPANDSAGIYGVMHIYRDDIQTAGVDEGAEPGDSLYFKINGDDAVATLISGDLTWTANGAQSEVNLAITGVTISFDVVVLPPIKAGSFGDTIRFEVGLENTGSGLDMYGISSMDDTSAFNSWTTNDQDSISYANPGETTYVYFDAILPVFGGGLDTVYTINYTVYSLIDTTVSYSDSVTLIKSITDTEDPWSVLPDQFALQQNYPNPFNPTTNIAFSLPERSTVRLEIINILGQTVDMRYLGEFPSGSHDIEYDASSLTSGVYFYRLTTDYQSLSRKMILLK